VRDLVADEDVYGMLMMMNVRGIEFEDMDWI
jgi:hypothetical protein